MSHTCRHISEAAQAQRRATRHDMPPGNSRSVPTRHIGTATASTEPTRSAKRLPARASASTTSAPHSPPAKPKPPPPRTSRASTRETSNSTAAATSADSPQAQHPSTVTPALTPRYRGIEQSSRATRISHLDSGF